MLPEGDYDLIGADLRVARRAVAVALVMSIAAEEVHPVREFLPSHSDMLEVLDAVGWVGAPESHVSLTPQHRRVLLNVVYAMLILALEESIRSADEALRSTPDSIDASILTVAESLTGLALRLRAGGAPGPGTLARGQGYDHTEQEISPALRALADSVGLPVWLAGADFLIEWVNPALEAVLGADVGQVRGTPWYQWSDPHDIPRVSQVIEAAWLEHRNWSVEVGAGPTGGPYTRLLVIAAPRRCADGALIGWTGICFDVSHNPGIPTRLGAVAQGTAVDVTEINRILRQLPALIWTTDRDLRCTFSNGAAFRSLGAESNQLVGRFVGEVVGTTDPGHPAIVAHQRAVAGETAQYRDVFAQRVFDVVVEPLHDETGAIIGSIGLGIEFTGTADDGV